MQKIYISGPITGVDADVCHSAFEIAEKDLKKQGFVPVNPLNNGLPDTATYEEHMTRDLEMLSECQGIYMLDGWERSKGCKIEFNFAIAHRIPIAFEAEKEKK